MTQPLDASRRFRIALLAILLLASSLTTAFAHQATPVPGGYTRLYLSHAARLTAVIPDGWRPDRTLVNDYDGPDGFIAATSTAFSSQPFPSLDAACAAVNGSPRYGGSGLIERMRWRHMDACMVRVENEHPYSPVSLVFAHPDPQPADTTIWAVVMVDAAHFDAVIASISFDLAGVTATAYLDAALDIISTHSLQRDVVDWESMRALAHQRLGGFADSREYWVADAALQIVVDALWAVGADRHTYLLLPADAEALMTTLQAYTPPTGTILAPGIGYLDVPSFGGSAEEGRDYTGRLWGLIDEQADVATCGWIVDLRGNPGGNMYPMIAGLAPLLPHGPLLTFRDANGTTVAVELSPDGQLLYDGEPFDAAVPAAGSVDPRPSTQPVAVLIGPNTASAAEATAVALAGRDRTVFIGEPTYGVATSPIWVPLLDGGLLAVTAAWTVGPEGAIYPTGILPDVTVSPSDIVDPLDQDPVVVAAIDWLHQQSGCALAATPAG